MEAIIGIDIGGTHTRIGLVDGSMRCVFPCRVVSSDVLRGGAGVAERLCALVHRYLQEVHAPWPGAVSVGVPSCVSTRTNRVYSTPNLLTDEGQPLMEDLALEQQLRDLLGLPVYVSKDTDLLLLHDAAAFSARGIVAGCYIGTGLGGAVCFDGDPLHGRNGLAMDIGHLSFWNEDLPCGCGKSGCAETVASGKALLRLHGCFFPDTPFPEIFVRHAGHPALLRFVRGCACLPALLLTVFDPDALVLGGGVLEMEGFPRGTLEDFIRLFACRSVAEAMPPIHYSPHMPERGVIGAALFAFRQLNISLHKEMTP